MKRMYALSLAAMLVAGTSVVSTSQAEARGRHHHGGGWIGPVLGGLALGALAGGGYYGYYGPRRYYYDDGYYPGRTYFYSHDRPYWSRHHHRHHRHYYRNWRQ